MNVVSAQMAKSIAGGSMIRRMFEAGNELKKTFGEDAVCDFSLGNPDLAPPVEVSEEFRALAVKSREPGSLGYMSNGGFAWALGKIASWGGTGTEAEARETVERKLTVFFEFASCNFRRERIE